jgi:hypothetical protein
MTVPKHLILCALCQGRFASNAALTIAIDRFRTHRCVPTPVRVLPQVRAR